MNVDITIFVFRTQTRLLYEYTVFQMVRSVQKRKVQRVKKILMMKKMIRLEMKLLSVEMLKFIVVA